MEIDNKVLTLANSLDLTDVWRTLNSDGKRFTWRRTKPEEHCRLDYLMISSSLTTAITNADILPVVRPIRDSPTTIHLASNNNPRGPGFVLETQYVFSVGQRVY